MYGNKARNSIFASPVVCIQPSGINIGQFSSSIEIDSHAQSITADEAVQLHAIVKDSSGNEIDSPVTWSASSGSIDASGLFIPGNIGVANITASSGQVNQTTSIIVTNGRPQGLNHTSITQRLA